MYDTFLVKMPLEYQFNDQSKTHYISQDMRNLMDQHNKVLLFFYFSNNLADNYPSSDDSFTQRHKIQPSPPSEEKPRSQKTASRKGLRTNSAEMSEARQSFVVSRPPSSKSTSKSDKHRSKTRSGSAGKSPAKPGSTSSIAALLQLKKAGLIKDGSLAGELWDFMHCEICL